MTTHHKVQDNDTQYTYNTMAISKYNTKYDARHLSSSQTQYSQTVENISSREHLCV